LIKHWRQIFSVSLFVPTTTRRRRTRSTMALAAWIAKDLQVRLYTTAASSQYLRCRPSMIRNVLLERGLCLLDSCVAPVYAVLTLVAASSLALPVLRDLASHGKTRCRGRSDAFLVRKSRFLHFYVCGLVSLAVVCGLSTSTVTASPATTDRTLPWPRMSVVLLWIHLARRTYECCFVHRSRTTSKMHVAGYLLGILHYVLLPLVFVSPPCPGTSFLTVDVSQLASSWVTVTVSLFCLWAQYQQCRHHCLLARLRPFTTTTINTKTDYRLPVGGWFEWVTCPHYFAEILIYVAFAVLLELEQHGSPQNRLWLRLRPVLLVVWVVTNLTLSAWQSHEWYVQHVADYARLGRSAIVPFLL